MRFVLAGVSAVFALLLVVVIILFFAASFAVAAAVAAVYCVLGWLCILTAFVWVCVTGGPR